MYASRAVRRPGGASTMSVLILFLMMAMQTTEMDAFPVRIRREVLEQQEPSQVTVDVDQGRKDRSLSFFDNFINLAAAGLGGMAGGGGGGLNFGGGYQNEADVDLYGDAISRAAPRRKIPNGYGGNQQYGGAPGYSNSPVYYIRMPPSPYVFVPGLGYVSPPPSMANSPLGHIPPQPAPIPQSPFVNLPLEFVSNAKPTGVYSWGVKKPRPSKPSKVTTTPKPTYSKPSATSKPQYAWPQPSIKPASQYDSPVTNLQGQYTFNGKPSSLYVLKNPFSSFYSDVLQSFYP